MTNKLTPGPWALDGGTNKKGDLYIWKAGEEYYGGHAIATVHNEIQEGAEANAQLIAAAPQTKIERDELLAACNDVRCAVERKEPLGGMVFQQAIDNVKAAIAKAEA